MKTLKINNKSINYISLPIGNLGDITYRALELLKEADIILCEDTRITQKLLFHFDINSRLESFHKYSEKNKIQKIVQWINDGKNISLVSDAGTPVISDPGNSLTKSLIDNDIKIVPIPGASALNSTIVQANFDISFFTFIGFLSKKEKKKFKTQINIITESEIPIAFFLSKHEFTTIINFLGNIIPDRKIIIAREITKMNETTYYGKISNVCEQINDINIRGEFSCIINSKEFVSKEISNEKIIEDFNHLKLTMSSKDAIIKISEKENIPKNIVYEICNKVN